MNHSARAQYVERVQVRLTKMEALGIPPIKWIGGAQRFDD
jgi:hypothetical protein